MIVVAEPKNRWWISVYAIELRADDPDVIWQGVELIREAYEDDYNIRVVDEWDGKLQAKSVWPFRHVKYILFVRDDD